MRILSTLRPISREAPARARLNSWKEIAAYLDRDPRTVQMWEKNEGLPVHRLNHHARASVYAYTAELNAWLRTRSGHGATNLHPLETEQPTRWRSRKALMWYSGAAALMLAAAGFGLWRWHVETALPPPAGAVVVLQFANQTSSDDLLVKTIADDLTADLRRAGRFPVISRRSVEAYQGRDVPLAQMAHELNAYLVVRGTIAEVDGQATATVELVNALRGAHLWGTTYSFKPSEVLNARDFVAGKISSDIVSRVAGAAASSSAEGKLGNPRAVQAYLTGRFYWNQRGLQSLRKAVSSFQEAIELDPKFASAYSGLADTYDLMTDFGIMTDSEAFSRAESNARTALALDPSSAEAYNALAFATYRKEWDFARAEEYFRKAIELNPNCAAAHQWYGEFLGDLRRFDESIAELRKAMELDPLSPMVGADLADGYLHAGRYREAEQELKRVIELYPDFVPAHRYLSALYYSKSQLDAAEAEARTYRELSGDAGPMQGLAIRRLMDKGDIVQARARVEAIANSATPPLAFHVAQLRFLVGQTDAGYRALEQAYAQHSWWLVTMLVDPGFGAVRNQPRFMRMAARVGLPMVEPASAEGSF